ncbi:hypothetical protein F5X99DRAFT_427624 [Biscogniauxia marginata]|nr:hypothetical protein F5X99DRAFT_427624 [Biscogniauxia marginata]
MDVMAETELRTRLPRKSSLGYNLANFSYPRPDGLSRHESSESRSSVTSNGSLPGMTDASDSDVSFDDDCNYNTSASELWDSFWPDSSLEPEQQYPAVLRASRGRDYFNTNPSGHQSHDTEDDTIKISQSEHEPKTTELSHEYAPAQPSPPRPETKRAPVSYSVYPKPSRTDIRRVELPPRTSSLNPELASTSRRKPFLRAAKSSAALKTSKSSHNLQPLYIASINSVVAEPLPSSSTVSSSYLPIPTTAAPKGTTASVPVSPAYPPPPVPKALRPSTSAFTLRDNHPKPRSPQLPTSHNVTAPLTPLLKAPPPVPRSQPPQQQQQQQQAPQPPRPEPQQRFVSVFDFDSDSDDVSDSGPGTRRGSSNSNDQEPSRGLAKRIARGLGHKKSASEKQRGRTAPAACSAPPPPPTPVLGGSGEFGEMEFRDERKERIGGGNRNSLSRKRGGSLGRIFGGFMSR